MDNLRNAADRSGGERGTSIKGGKKIKKTKAYDSDKNGTVRQGGPQENVKDSKQRRVKKTSNEAPTGKTFRATG